uniref:Putative secreted protein n=1 Tax=Ixodes ricinus TaxID=34613 RepID=A0A6B0UNA5_IXORI
MRCACAWCVAAAAAAAGVPTGRCRPGMPGPEGRCVADRPAGLRAFFSGAFPCGPRIDPGAVRRPEAARRSGVPEAPRRPAWAPSPAGSPRPAAQSGCGSKRGCRAVRSGPPAPARRCTRRT